MPSAPISSVASALNFGSCRTVVSGASSTAQQYTALRYSRFCDVDCDVTLPRIGENDRFCADTRRCSTRLTVSSNAGEAPQFQELRRHSRSSPLTASHTTRPIHTQEVTGSSPVAPTILLQIRSRQVLPIGGTLAECDPFATPSTLHWTGAAIIVQSCRTKTCIVTRSRTANRPTPSLFGGVTYENDGGRVSAADGSGT